MVSRFLQSRGRSAAVHDGIDERLELIAELARALAGPLDTEELGVAFLRRLRRVIPSQATAAVMLTQPEGEMVLTIAADGPLSAEISQSAFSLSALPLELRTTFDERKPIVLLDTLITSDVVGVDAWTDLCSHVQTLRTARFVVLLPLVWRETPVGVVFIRDDAARAADARRVQLLSVMADHLASALYTAIATGDEAGRTQRMALIERLVERVGSAPSAEKSIKSVLDDLGRMLGASAALAWNQADGEDLQLLAAWSAAGVRVGEQLRGSASPVEKLAVLNGETVAFDAIANEARLEGFDRALLSEIGVVSSLAVPLHFPRRRVGALVFHQVGQARTWDAHDLELVETIADKVGERAEEGAISPISSQTSISQARRDPADTNRLRGLHQVASVAAAASDAEAVLHEVVRAAILLLNGDRGALFQLEKSGELSVLQRWPMVDVGIVDELPEEELAARALVREQPLIINPSLAVEDADAGERPSEPKAIAAVPVVRGGSSVAALVVLSFDDSIRFSDDDARVLTLLGQLVAPLLVDSTDRAQASLPDAADSRQTPTSFEPPPPADVDRLEREDETAQRVTRFDDGSSGGSQAEVRQIRRSQQEFLALISHQFRTPLTSIQGFSEMMVDEDLSPGELKEYASDINRDAKRLDRILGEMIELASIESGQAGVEVESINLNSVVEEVADRARVAAPGRKLRLELDDTMALVAADRSHLSEVVARLIENAFEYTPDQGEIVLGSRANCEFAHVSVAHAGVGLTEDALGRLFDPFAEYDGDAAAYMGGIRLGLPIVSRLVALQGGEAWAERTIGEGAVFHFTMPLAPVLDGATDSME